MKISAQVRCGGGHSWNIPATKYLEFSNEGAERE